MFASRCGGEIQSYDRLWDRSREGSRVSIRWIERATHPQISEAQEERRIERILKGFLLIRIKIKYKNTSIIDASFITMKRIRGKGEEND